MWCGKAALILGGAVYATAATAGEAGGRAAGRGGAGIADGANGTGGATNIAAATLEDQYLAFTSGLAGVDHTWGVRAGALDTRTAAFGLSAGYYRRWDDVTRSGADLPGWKVPGDDLANPAVHQGGWIAAAYPFLDRRLALGVDTRLDFYESDILGKDSAFNFGAQVAGRPTEWLTLALSGRNLLDTHYRDTQRTLALGARLHPGSYFGAELDVSAPLTSAFSASTLGWHTGLDVGLAEVVALRAGFEADGGNYVTAGLGLVSQQADLDYGARMQLSEPSRTWHELELRVKF